MVTTSSNTELSRAVSIARPLQVSFHRHSLRKFTATPPFLENVTKNFFPCDELAFDGLELDRARKKPQLSRIAFGMVIRPFLERMAFITIL